MPKKQIKRKTTLAKIPRKRGRLKEIELPVRGRTKDVVDASQVINLSGSQCGRDVENRESGLTANLSNLFVPVVDKDNKPLMPTTCSRAKRWIKNGRGTGFWKRGIYCMRLNAEPSERKFQQIVLGIDPGSKKEGYTMKSNAHTYLNIQADAVTWVHDNMEARQDRRRTRRGRTTPCRKNKYNKRRSKLFIPPSTKSRWQWKLRISNWLIKMFPITDFIVEDIKANTFGTGKKWNTTFSPLQVGKNWFYNELKKIGILHLKRGWETKELRNKLGLRKIKNKMSEKFEAHCIDSWVLANSIVNGHFKPDNKSMIYMKSLRFHRRQLHVQNPTKGGIRKKYGGTNSIGLRRGSLSIHKKHGLIFIGGGNKKYCVRGKTKEIISLHNVKNGQRICQHAYLSDTKFLSYNSFITYRNFK